MLLSAVARTSSVAHEPSSVAQARQNHRSEAACAIQAKPGFERMRQLFLRGILGSHLMEIVLPNSVRYVKNGRGGQWWRAARANNQVHLGWKSIPQELLLKPDFPTIKQVVKTEFGLRQGATQDFNALCDLLDAPSKYVWMTFEDGCMWWCTVLDGAIINPDGESLEKGNFWLACNRHWSNQSRAKPAIMP